MKVNSAKLSDYVLPLLSNKLYRVRTLRYNNAHGRPKE